MAADPKDQIEAFKAVREIAAILVSQASQYVEIIEKIIEPETFEQGRDQALSVAIVTAQVQNATLESLQELKLYIDSPYHPPLSAVLAVGMISTSCLLITSADTVDNLADVPLLSIESLQLIMANSAVKNWLEVCLGASE